MSDSRNKFLSAPLERMLRAESLAAMLLAIPLSAEESGGKKGLVYDMVSRQTRVEMIHYAQPSHISHHSWGWSRQGKLPLSLDKQVVRIT
jgi:hypothetical protein